MGDVVPGYPVPVQIPNEIRPDPDEENPNELVLDASEVSPALPPLQRLTRPARNRFASDPDE